MILTIHIKDVPGQAGFINWLNNHLLPCPFKYLTGIDCPFCGFQRSILALIEGNFTRSFILYPAAVPLLLYFGCLISKNHLKDGGKTRIFRKSLLIVTVSILIISYGIKLWKIF